MNFGALGLSSSTSSDHTPYRCLPRVLSILPICDGPPSKSRSLSLLTLYLRFFRSLYPPLYVLLRVTQLYINSTFQSLYPQQANSAMHSQLQHISPSSSAASSRSGSPDTRATTPSSHSESEYLPASHVYLFGTLPNPEALKAIFSKHASSERMSLIIEDSAEPVFLGPAPQEWAKECLPGSTKYYVSSSYQPVISSVSLFFYEQMGCRLIQHT